MESYPKVYNIGHPAIDQLFSDPVVVEEKVDGSQFSFGVYGGELKCRSKSKLQELVAPDKMFNAAVETIKELAPLLTDGYTYRGEYLSKPKHNALAYNRIPDKHIILFDINNGPERYLERAAKADEAGRIGLELVPQMFLTEPTLENFMVLIDRTSVLGGQKMEGLVVKNYSRFGRDGKALMGKYVSEAFREVHSREWVKDNPQGKDIVALLTAKYLSDARWAKAVQRLTEAGNLKNEPADIGPLIKEVQADIEAECSDEIAAQLLAWALPNILRGSIKGLPQWYKTKLLEGAFRANEKAAP